MDKDDVAHTETITELKRLKGQVELYQKDGEEVVLIPTPSPDPRGELHLPDKMITIEILTSKRPSKPSSMAQMDTSRSRLCIQLHSSCSCLGHGVHFHDSIGVLPRARNQGERSDDIPDAFHGNWKLDCNALGFHNRPPTCLSCIHNSADWCWDLVPVL